MTEFWDNHMQVHSETYHQILNKEFFKMQPVVVRNEIKMYPYTVGERAARMAKITQDVIAPACKNTRSYVMARKGYTVKVLKLNHDGTALVRHPDHENYPPLQILRPGEFELA